MVYSTYISFMSNICDYLRFLFDFVYTVNAFAHVFLCVWACYIHCHL